MTTTTVKGNSNQPIASFLSKKRTFHPHPTRMRPPHFPCQLPRGRAQWSRCGEGACGWRPTARSPAPRPRPWEPMAVSTAGGLSQSRDVLNLLPRRLLLSCRQTQILGAVVRQAGIDRTTTTWSGIIGAEQVRRWKRGTGRSKRDKGGCGLGERVGWVGWLKGN
jgi:hypothetical protein